MSDELFSEAGLIVSRFCGPAGPPDRRRFAFLIPDGSSYADLSITEAQWLVAALQQELHRQDLPSHRLRITGPAGEQVTLDANKRARART